MKKILNKLFIIASLGLIAAGAIFLCVSIFDGNETTTPLAAALACILLSNLFRAYPQIKICEPKYTYARQ